VTARTNHSPDHTPRSNALNQADNALNQADLAALKRSYSDLSDLDERTKARARAGFQHAYTVAQRVVDGRVDPMSV
jgi:hypothetical protein